MFGATLLLYTSGMFSSGSRIMTTSAFLTASLTSATLMPAASTLDQEAPPLRAVADDGDVLALDQAQIGVFVVVDLHVVCSVGSCECPKNPGRLFKGIAGMSDCGQSDAQDALAAPDPAGPGAHGFEDGSAVDGFDEGIELGRVAGQFNGVSLVRHVDEIGRAS